MPRPPVRVSDAGSPPLARGALQRPDVRARSGRLTPARAGSTRAAPRTRWRRWAHPHSRGEHVSVSRSPAHRPGSPPLARGAPDPEHSGVGVHRLTPARAGSTGWSGGCGTLSQAHPRSRGEHAPAVASQNRGVGSPPLARGARTRRSSHPARVRLTPARAGSTLPGTRGPGSARAHPRSRGEHCGPDLAVDERGEAGVRGSPPLARGALPSWSGTYRTS